MTQVLDQQYIVHLYAPAEGPDAAAAYRALSEIWQGCRLLFQMTEPIPGVDLPTVLPEELAALPGDGETAIAALEHRTADHQAILRKHQDLLNLSVALAPPQSSDPQAEDWSWWRSLDLQWSLLTSDHAAHLVGEARLYLARLDSEPEVRLAGPTTFELLSGLLPASARDWRAARGGVPTNTGLAVWETTPEPDNRPLRRFVIAIAPESDPTASAWTWSRGDTAIPPLARYLLHAAKLRYELRVWQRDDQTRQTSSALGTITAELQRLGGSASAEAELLRLRSLEASFLLTDLRSLRHAADVAVDNLSRAFDLSGLLLADGPFADDASLGRSFLNLLDDQIATLGIATDHARNVIDLHRPAPPPDSQHPAAARPSGPVPAETEGDRSRNVFVVYGRDNAARTAVFEFLTSLGLWPLEWEDLVAFTGRSAPFLGDVIAHGMPLAQAVLVLLTPDDIVNLHPDLHEVNEAKTETQQSMQARPNVLLELGMALAVHPDRTVILTVGHHRAVSDISGRNFVRTEDADFRKKVANRLQLAGCPTQTPAGGGWLTAGDFSTLTAHHRVPDQPVT